MFGSGKPQFNTAQGYADYVKEQERQQHIQDIKESQLQQYNAEMKQLAKAAVDETKKNNEIAQQSLKVAQDSKFLAKLAIWTSAVAIVISVILHYL